MVRYNYKFPGRFEPFKHQLETWEALIRNPRFFVFNDIGTGKTLSSLWAADFLQQHKKIGKVLIVTTLSTVWCVWADELFKTFPHKKFGILHASSKARRLKELAKDCDFYIVNHDGIKVLEAELHGRPDITHIILDEGAQFRNKRTDKWATLNRLCGPVTVRGTTTYLRSVWWMTGSPMPHAPTDVWAQCRIVNPNMVSKYFSHFRDLVMYQQNMYKWSPRTGWERYIYSLLEPIAIRFERDKCLDLPPCVTEMRICDMSADQAKAYQQMRKTLVLELKQGHITAANEGVKRLKLLQLACGAVYDESGNVITVDVKPKLRVLFETLEEAGGKVLIFTPFKHVTAMLYKVLKKKYSVDVVTGDTGTSKRTKIFNAFQEGDLQLIVAHPQTMAHGLTMTASSTIIWWGPIDSYEIYEQATGRITRPGAKQKQTIVQLVCSDIERLVYERLAGKQSMQGLLLDLLRK